MAYVGKERVDKIQRSFAIWKCYRILKRNGLCLHRCLEDVVSMWVNRKHRCPHYATNKLANRLEIR